MQQQRCQIAAAGDELHGHGLGRLETGHSPQVAHHPNGLDQLGELTLQLVVEGRPIQGGPALQRQKGGVGLGGEAVPELFAQVGHQRMQHHQQGAQHLGQHLAGHPLVGQGPRTRVLTGVEPPLEQLDRPVADLIPGELIEALGRLAQAIGAIALGGFSVHPGQARQDPAVGQLQGLGIGVTQSGGRLAAQVHQGEAGGVPELVGKVAGPLHRGGGVRCAVVVEADVLAGTGHLPHQGKAQGIGAVALNQQQRINAIARRFAHLAVVLIPHQAVDVNVLERNPRDSRIFPPSH